MGRILEHLVLPVHIRIDQWVAAILELLQFGRSIGCCETIVHTGTVQGISIVVGTYHVGHLRVKLYLMRSAHLEVVLPIFAAMLGLHQQHAVDSLVSV